MFSFSDGHQVVFLIFNVELNPGKLLVYSSVILISLNFPFSFSKRRTWIKHSLQGLPTKKSTFCHRIFKEKIRRMAYILLDAKQFVAPD